MVNQPWPVFGKDLTSLYRASWQQDQRILAQWMSDEAQSKQYCKGIGTTISPLWYGRLPVMIGFWQEYYRGKK